MINIKIEFNRSGTLPYLYISEFIIKYTTQSYVERKIFTLEASLRTTESNLLEAYQEIAHWFELYWDWDLRSGVIPVLVLASQVFKPHLEAFQARLTFLEGVHGGIQTRGIVRLLVSI
ncbi:hypothetical protein PanWU01x14_259010 [Parasponia andersonii]|uniref:Uncharacterized protein n=1 Tax=Parasponia andersonii TaxID=3476 RepID=A0A2P5B9G5_PARAD|nr:hypothetical protein PanWU01x14_259010 [Parasponia andersonii]